MSNDIAELMLLAVPALTLLIVFVLHELAALRLLTRRLFAGVLALLAPVPVTLAAVTLPLSIAVHMTIFGDRHWGRDSFPAQVFEEALEIGTSEGGLLAWGGAMTVSIVPILLSLLAHLGATPERREAYPSDLSDASWESPSSGSSSR